MLTRAVQGLPLTPHERAILKLLWGVIWTGVIGAVGALAILISSGAQLAVQSTYIAVGAAFVVGILNAVAKLVSANGDVYSGIAVGTLASAIDKRYVRGLNDVKTPQGIGTPTPTPSMPA